MSRISTAFALGLVALLGLSSPTAVHAQDLKAKSNTAFIDETRPNSYFFTTEIVSGSISRGGEFDIVGVKGERVGVRAYDVQRRTYNETSGTHSYVSVPSVTQGDEVTLYFEVISGNGSDLREDFMVVGKGASFPGVQVAADAPRVEIDEKAGSINATIDGRPWQGFGFYNSFLYYPSGAAQFFDGKPVLILAFKDADGRQLTFNVYDDKVKVGTYQKDKIEVLYSGTDLMYGHKHPNLSSKDLKIEITSWRMVEDGKARVSGTISGKLKRSLCPTCKPEILMAGKFEGIKVDVHP